MCTEKKSVNSAVMSTCSEEDNESACAPSPEEDCEEELQYGPGIVSKLRTRFLSITLKQQNRGLLRSNMRRSCSLEDLLDQGRSTQDNIFTGKGCCGRGNRNQECDPSCTNLKRAKSMDSLILSAEDQTDRPNEDHTSEELSRKEKCEIVESLTSNNHHIPKLVKRKEGALNRSTVSICDEELPKPDTVKIYKRMFEPADGKRGMSHSNVRRKPPVLRASAKVGTATSAKAPAQKKVVNGSASSNELKNSVIKENGNVPANSKFEAKEKVQQVNGVENGGIIKNGQHDNLIENKKQPDALKNRSVGKKILNPPIKEEEEEMHISEGHDTESKKDEPLTRYKVRTTKKSFETSSKPSLPPNKPVLQGSRKKPHLNPTEKKALKKQAPEAPKPPVEVVQKEPVVLRESESSQTNKENSECYSRIQQKEGMSLEGTNGLAASPPLTNGYVCDVQQSPDSGLDNKPVQDIINSEVVVSKETQQQVDKTVVTQKELSSTTNNKTPLWQHKSSQNGASNSMVFDFRGKDVVHHLSVQPAPFGSKALRTRSLLIDGKEAIPYTNGSVNGNSADDEDDEYVMDYSYPPPSGVIFEGENVIVGKGAILTVRNKSLKIQFDDDVDHTFVYPSESSLLEECESPTTANSSEAESDATEDDDGNDENDLSNGRPPKLRSNTTIGITGGLATYTPSVLRTVDNFEPGMFRPGQNEIIVDGDKSKHESPIQNGIQGEEDGEAEMLKPADPELISSWSLSTATSDLLF